MAKKITAKPSRRKKATVLSYKKTASAHVTLHEDTTPYIVDTPRKQRTSTVAANRKYAVEFVSAAKSISTGWLKTHNLENAVGFGLPEVDDRYHIWRVPLVKAGTKERIGEVVIDAYTSLISASETTVPDILEARLLGRNESEKTEQNGNGEHTQMLASFVRNTVIFGDSERALLDMPSQSVDLIFTSPPYYNARPEYEDYLSYESYLLKMRHIIHNCHRVLSEGRFFAMNVSPVLIRRASRNEASQRIAVPFDLHRIFTEEGFDFIDDIHWVKPSGAGWATGRGRRFAADRQPLQYKAVPVTEYILVYRKHTEKLIDWNIRNHPDQQAVKDSKITGEYEATNLWRIHPTFHSDHPAVFPLELHTAKDFSRQLPQIAFQNMTNKASKAEKALGLWTIGLTGKSFQNVLHGDVCQLSKYIVSFAANLERLAVETEKISGKLECRVKSSDGKEAVLDWHDLLSLFCTIGSQTLAIRGSEKSTYGKLFERLVLGSVLNALGFEQSSYPPKKTSKVFWLSSKVGEREADATLLVSDGQAVKFDLGFIGIGNPEIPKDKVSRFERFTEINEKKFDSATCIIVDRIGEGSSLEKHANRVGAKIIQMSLTYWPIVLAQWLHKKFNYKSDILTTKPEDLSKLLKKKLATVSFENFVQGLIISETDEAEQSC